MQRQRSRGRILRLETVETVVRIPWPSHLHARICEHNICVHNICEQYAQHTRTVRLETACSSMVYRLQFYGGHTTGCTCTPAQTNQAQTKRRAPACNERRAARSSR